MRANRIAVILAVWAAFLALGTAPQAAPARRIYLHLKALARFDPAADSPAVDRELTTMAAEQEQAPPFGFAVKGKAAGKLEHWIVQYDGPVHEEWKPAIYNLGGLLLDYVPDYGFVVRIPAQQVRGLRNLPHVRSVQPYHPAYALSPNLPKRPVTIPIAVTTFQASDVNGVVTRIKRTGGAVTATGVEEPHGVVLAQVRPGTLKQVARAFGVAWVELRDRPELHNDKSIGVCNVDDVRANVGLYGANQLVAVYDTGLDTGNTGTVHPDFTGRIAATHSYGNQGGWFDYNGHGTHTMGTVLGSGVSSGSDISSHNYPITGTPCYAGFAPEAMLVVQSGINTDGSLAGTDSLTFKQILKDAYDDGARVHSDSWGFSNDGTYNTVCAAVDAFAYQAKDMMICFSAGNSGVDASPKDGLIDSGSKRAPGISKNVIDVGASENNRPTVNLKWGNNYGSPINTDFVADNANGMCPFSSRGPCDDSAGPGGELRIKPDVVAPGSEVASPRTSLTFLTESFDSSTVGTQPSGWSTTGIGSVINSDSHSSSNCYGIGNSTAGQGYGISSTLFVTSAAPLSTQRASLVGVSFWTRFDLKAGDTAYVARNNGYLNGVFTGSSGGWTYVTVLVLNNPATAGIQFILQPGSVSSASENHYWEIDDLRVWPILSTSLGYVGVEAGGSARDLAYQVSDGTSMSCPAVAGMSALTREYYRERKNYLNPSAALLKATLITSAASMGTGQYASPQEIPTTRPNSVNGWGRVDLQKALAPSSTSFPNTKQLFADVSTGLKTGGVDTYTVTVAAGTPLNVGLVYTDPPAAAAAAVTLVNNLDLSVDPDGAGPTVASRGNGVSGGDARNNVETVDFASPVAGTYTITVSGTNVPAGQQPYALVIYGNVAWQNSLSVSPATTQCQLGHTVQLQALLNGMPTSGVTWSVVSGVGSVSAAGVYTAPASGSSATVRATYGALTADSVITLVSASTSATAYVTITHSNWSHITAITVGIGPDPNNSVAGVQFGVSQTGSNTFIFTLPVDSLAGYLPPSASNPWWVKITDTTAGDVGTIQDFYVLLGTASGGVVSTGERYSGTNLPTAVGDTTGPPYAWIDTVSPSVSMTAPASGGTVSGSSVTFSASASDNDQIARVDFFVDDRLLGSDTTATAGSYSVTWDTTAETNVKHRLTVRTTDRSGNTAEDFRLVTTNNAGTRPNVVLSLGSYSFNSTTRELTATATFNNTGGANAFKVTLQRLTLYGTGSTFTGYRQVYMEPQTGSSFPRSVGSVNAGASTTLQLHAIIPPEVTSLPRWAGTGTYYDAASGGSRYNL